MILGGVVATAVAAGLAFLLPLTAGVFDVSASTRLIMFMLAAIALSSIVGFIFGVPRTRVVVSGEGSETIKTATLHDTRPGRFEANSNLEQISDWLTKVLVGAGLAQLALVPTYIRRVGDYLGSAIQLPGGAQTCVAFVLYGVGVGFIFAYLWARLRLRVLLEESERIADAKAVVKADVGRFLKRAQIQSGSAGDPRELARAAEDAGALTERGSSLGRILWVDDHPRNNRELVAAFRRIGVDVNEVTSTADALEEVETGSYRLVITDMGRTEGGTHVRDAGIRLLRELRRHRIALPVLVYTSERIAETPAQLFNAGAQYVTASPTELYRVALSFVR